LFLDTLTTTQHLLKPCDSLHVRLRAGEPIQRPKQVALGGSDLRIQLSQRCGVLILQALHLVSEFTQRKSRQQRKLHHKRCNPFSREHFYDLIVSEVLNSLVSLGLKLFVGLLELRLHLSQAIKQLLCLDLNSLDAALRPLLTLRKGGKRLDRLVEISLEEASFLGVEHI